MLTFEMDGYMWRVFLRLAAGAGCGVAADQGHEAPEGRPMRQGHDCVSTSVK